MTAEAIKSLSEFFKSADHSPSSEMWSALRHIIATMERMADETIEDRYFLSSIDPGVGKSQACVHFLRTLVASPRHGHVGAIVFLSTIDQIRAMVGDANLRNDEFAVLTSDEKANRLGRGSDQASEAQVLFTTQQRLDVRLQRFPSFAAINEFHYRGIPRTVRVWDESLVPARPLMIERDQIASLLGPVRRRYPDLADTLEQVFTSVRTVEHGTSVPLPDFATEHSVSADDVLALRLEKHQRRVVRGLWYLSGRPVTVRQEGKRRTILDYEDNLPSDLKPMLILDASGRLRFTYPLWGRGIRGDLVKLPSASKSYSPLTVHVWERSGAKNAWRRYRDELVAGIVAAIRAKPDQDWLIVHHRKESIGLNLRGALRRELADMSGRLEFLTWGKHSASNEYKEFPNVVLAGLLHYPHAYHEATGRAALGLSTAQGDFSEDDLRAMRRGEFLHDVLQAACRGRVRGCEGAACKPCALYLIADKRSLLARDIGEIFPGCCIAPWSPLGMAKTKKHSRGQRALAMISQRITEEPGAVVPFRDVMQALGMRDPNNFRRDVRSNPSFRAELARIGVEEVRAGPRSGFRCALPPQSP